ncbi:hypothetical protein ES703_06629 [subsurface metagenome]
MNIEQKKIYFVLSPHINYYHSYRGDSRGDTGFGKDLKMMRGILNELDKIEDVGFKFGNMRITWDYGDTFWSIQLQKEFQQDVLDRVIERCKKGKDEVLIGSWGNVAQPILDTEEFIQQYKWFLENSMGIGVNQLFPGRVAPYARTQETMFTQGMIELYNKLGVEGICIYYSMYGFDVARPFINPRLDWNQRYGVVKFNSTITDASCLMIPMYGFGDILDYCSIKRWFEIIRQKQKSGEISGHALIFLNFDMDYENWIGLKLPKFLSWMPNSRGLMEFAEAVDQYDYAEFTNLLDIIPKLKIQGETLLREDVADGMFNGYYNWAQKFNNTKFWTIGQSARWLKCVSDTLISEGLAKNSKSEINNFLRNPNDSADSYLKSKILFASTTNFGMAMPFLHSDRRKTAMSYVLKSFIASEKAVNLATREMIKTINNDYGKFKFIISITPITNRGISEKEKISVDSSILIQLELPSNFKDQLIKQGKFLKLLNLSSNELLKSYSVYNNESGLKLEAIIPKSAFSQNDMKNAIFSISFSESRPQINNQELIATKTFMKNKYIALEFNNKGKINSFKFNHVEFGCPKFLESSINFYKSNKGKMHNSDIDEIIIQRDGSDGFSASIKIKSEFEIEKHYRVYSEKTIKLYSELPYLFVDVLMHVPEIKGETTNIGKSDGSSYFVEEKYNKKWKEIMPCEIRSNILGTNKALRIWKKNFLGNVDYFNLDMKEVDPKNADIDCLVANISDGWMALSNQEKGLLIGFDSLKAANFAFSPLKFKDKGFGDIKMKGQQIRINPFGTYYGEVFHYWTEGNGHAQKITANLIGTNESTAPTFSGKTISFNLLLSPYIGDSPPKVIQSFADHFSFKPLILMQKKGDLKDYNDLKKYANQAERIKQDFELKEVMKMSYIDWVRNVNKNYDPSISKVSSSKGLGIPLGTILRVLIDGIKGR